MFDVVVVGGGPAGCYTASLLGQRGFDVHVLEEHSVIGEPVDCSGVIGAEAFGSLGFPQPLKLGVISQLTLVSPSKLEVNFSPQAPLAYIVDRSAFDRVIADKTVAAGVTLHLGVSVVDLQRHNDYVELDLRESVPPRGESENRNGGETSSRTIKARLVILAGGPRYKFQRKLDMGVPRRFLRTAQTIAEVRGIKETKILMGSHVAPGSFAWIIPYREGKSEFARIGVSAIRGAAPFLGKLLDMLRSAGHLVSPSGPIRSWIIPVSPIKRTYEDRVLAVGDAAGQTKPTTGGGLYYGLLCAEAAAKTAIGAFEKGDLSARVLKGYENTWRHRLGGEIKVGAFFRRMVERLTDNEIDDLFRIAQSDGIVSAVNKNARFDWHKNIIYLALRHPKLGRIILGGLFR